MTWYVSTVARVAGSDVTVSTMAGGSASKALSIGANTVNGPSLLSVSISSAWVTSAARVSKPGSVVATSMMSPNAGTSTSPIE